MLRLLAQSQRSIKAGRYKPLKKAFADLTARTKTGNGWGDLKKTEPQMNADKR